MTFKTPQENVALLDRNHYEQTNVLNERIEQIRNEPETRFNEPPPAYEDVCPDKCIEKVEQGKPLNPYYVLVFQIITWLIGITEIIFASIIAYLKFSSLNLVVALDLIWCIILLVVILLMGLSLLSTICFKNIKLYIVYFVLGVALGIGTFIGVLILCSSLQEIDVAKKNLTEKMAEVKKELDDYAYKRDLLSHIVHPKIKIPDMSELGIKLDHKKIWPNYKEYEDRYETLKQQMQETQTRIDGLQQQYSLKTTEEDNLRSLLILLVILCIICAFFLLIVFQTYQTKKKENKAKYKKVESEDNSDTV